MGALVGAVGVGGYYYLIRRDYRETRQQRPHRLRCEVCDVDGAPAEMKEHALREHAALDERNWEEVMVEA